MVIIVMVITENDIDLFLQITTTASVDHVTL